MNEDCVEKNNRNIQLDISAENHFDMKECRVQSKRFSYPRLNNHSIIALILISLIETTTELPITLEYLRLGHVQPMKYSFCLFWIWYNFSLQTINLIIPLASLSLLIQAKKMRRIVADWKSRRKMILQLMIISLLYLIFYSPLALISLLRIYPTFVRKNLNG